MQHDIYITGNIGPQDLLTINYLLYKTDVVGTHLNCLGKSAAADQGLHYLSLIQRFLDTSTSSKIELFKFQDKYVKEFQYFCNIW